MRPRLDQVLIEDAAAAHRFEKLWATAVRGPRFTPRFLKDPGSRLGQGAQCAHTRRLGILGKLMVWGHLGVMWQRPVPRRGRAFACTFADNDAKGHSGPAQLLSAESALAGVGLRSLGGRDATREQFAKPLDHIIGIVGIGDFLGSAE